MSLAGGNKLQPFVAGSLVFGGENFHLVAAFEHMAHGYQLMVDFGADATVAQLAVHLEGKIQGGGSLSQGFDLSLGGKYEDFGRKQVHLDGVQHIEGVGLGAFQNLLDGEYPMVELVVFFDFAQFVFPVGGKTPFGNAVHSGTADLDFDPIAGEAHHRGVQSLITIGFGVVYPVAQTVGVRLVNIGDGGINIPALFLFEGKHLFFVLNIGRIENDTDSQKVVDFFEPDVFGGHFLPDGIGCFYSFPDIIFQVQFIQFVLNGLYKGIV